MEIGRQQRKYTTMIAAIFAGATSIATNAADSLPCWYENPVTIHQSGQVGVARDLYTGGHRPLDLGKARALDGLCRQQGQTCSPETLVDSLNRNQLLGKPVFFAHFSKDGYLYAYASYQPVDDRQCTPSRCDLSACDPSWLCNPAENNTNGILGVSYRATSTPKQFDLATSNALLQAEYLYGVEVTAAKELQQSQYSRQRLTLLMQESNVDLGERETLPYQVSQQCRSGSSLFQRVVLSDQLTRSADIPADDLEWLENPKHLGFDGAIGVVENPTGSGLLSDQIELALHRAATELAFEKSVDVSDDSFTMTTDQGYILLTTTKESTHTELKARVLSIHFAPGSDGFLKVYAWVAAM